MALRESHAIDLPSKTMLSSEAFSIPFDLTKNLCWIFGALYLYTATMTSMLQMCPICRFYISENDWLIQLSLMAFGLTYFIMFLRRENHCSIRLIVTLLMIFQTMTIAVFVIVNNSLGVLHSLWLTSFILLMVGLYIFLRSKKCYSFCKIVVLLGLLFLPFGAYFLQVVLGCKMDELILSLILCSFLAFYHLYFSILTVKNFLNLKYFSIIAKLYMWPLLSFTSKM